MHKFIKISALIALVCIMLLITLQITSGYDQHTIIFALLGWVFGSILAADTK